MTTNSTTPIPTLTHTSPFASPNAIPPRTSSNGVLNSKPRASVLVPLSEIDWMSQGSTKSRLSASRPLEATTQPQQTESQTSQQTNLHSQIPQQQSQMDQQQPDQKETPQIPPQPSNPPSNGDNIKGFGDQLIYGSTSWTGSKEQILLGPYDYLIGHPGKDVRSHFIAAFNKWLRVPAERLEVITRVVGMLHTASLLVDDVEDSSVLRRGIPVANSIYGIAQTINSANYVYFKALQEITEMRNPALISIFTEELLNLHRGQGMELYWRDSLTCPSEADYLEMVGNKTGGLFRLAIKLMQAESEIDIDCSPLVSTVGILFQILDDHKNLSDASGYSELKGLCEDLTEGKFSFPIIHAIRADPSNRVLVNILKQKTKDDEVKRYAVKYMEQMGSFEYSEKVIQELKGKSAELIAKGEREVGGEAGREGADALRGVLARLVLK
ncbi:terpenoid synthase [Sporormia fimetaria CBS 119925]|uniref:geranylgeranyl diphosphate synthase n=1 Tax=Sporormia fimetaria CBS 119925 TaxID=1340428 RepID=A0A6A6VA07_9PLEO|nr:terpenoid synthase [Sporormia fimetaria CBS 119925]